ncbi:MAG: glycerophosphodiester phosphodiesterase family protein [Luteibaculaceae bacterium]
MKKLGSVKILIYSFVFLMFSCTTDKKESNSKGVVKLKGKAKIEIQGHRGCRGLMPENTIAGFLHAQSLGIQTLELDVVITQDSLILVSHEPWFSHEISLKPGGEPVKEEEEKNFNIFEMSYNKTQNFDVGIINHPRFPGQDKFNATKPLLSDVLESSLRYAEKNNLVRPKFNVEIKSYEEWDGKFIPEDLEFYVDKVVETLLETVSIQDFNLQSFDTRVLNLIKSKYPDIKVAYLVEENKDFKNALSKINFKPEIYSCHFSLVNKKLLEFCKKEGIKLIPWTVNDISVMEQLIQMEVDAIITDYPNVAIALLNGDLS